MKSSHWQKREGDMRLLSVEQQPARRILLACIGNIFLGDDGFGVEVARQLLQREQRYPANVQVSDFGICGLDLAYALLEDYDTLILVDTVQRGSPPGTLYLVEPDLSQIDSASGASAGRMALDAHSMDPLRVLGFARTLGAQLMRTLLVGCEPAELANESDYSEMQVGLSAPVQAALAGALHMLDTLIAELLLSPVEQV
jgi:hydrogenase maturation protease